MLLISHLKKISKNYQNNWNLKRITEVEHIKNYSLKIVFEDGKCKTIDFESYLKSNPVYKQFLNLKKFLSFYIEDNGALHWKGNLLDFHYSTLYNWK
jgi:hypothetical protein